ncbi:hypothetical protein [Vibrio sp. TRT 17S01]|uniref:hypothetical protein n=1 Tax=Vibrio sp. TRT 17S01 TaxID=3418505 RepID=UPI003CF23245
MNRFLITLIVLVLSGCNSSGDESTNADKGTSDNTQSETTNSTDGFVYHRVTDLNTKSLKLDEIIPGKDAASFTEGFSIYPVFGNCSLPSENSDSLPIYFDEDAQWCVYKYSFDNAGSSSAYSNPEASTYNGNLVVEARNTSIDEPVPPTSNAAFINDSFQIKLSNLVPYGVNATVDKSTIYVDKGTFVPSTTDDDRGHYVAPSQPGHDYILMYADKADGGRILIRMDISVNFRFNFPPKVTDFDFYVDDGSATGRPVRIGETVSIDLKPYVSDSNPHLTPDVQDPLSLVKVYSNSGTISDINANGLTFKYKVTDSLLNSISYVVTDAKGGVGIGRINIKASSVYQNVVVNGLEYFPPLDNLQMQLAGFETKDVIVGNGTSSPDGVKASTVTLAVADGICRARGMDLATPAQLTNLFNEKGNLFTAAKWPVDRHYWSDSGIAITTVNLSNGVTGSMPATSGGYYSCVKQAVYKGIAFRNEPYVLRNDSFSPVVLEVVYETQSGTKVTYDGPKLAWNANVMDVNNTSLRLAVFGSGGSGTNLNVNSLVVTGEGGRGKIIVASEDGNYKLEREVDFALYAGVPGTINNGRAFILSSDSEDTHTVGFNWCTNKGYRSYAASYTTVDARNSNDNSHKVIANNVGSLARLGLDVNTKPNYLHAGWTGSRSARSFKFPGDRTYSVENTSAAPNGRAKYVCTLQAQESVISWDAFY